MQEIASALVRSGLAAQGYVYVNMDDTWAGPRDNATQALVPQPKKFPSGMAALTSYVHAKQLKFGVSKRTPSIAHDVFCSCETVIFWRCQPLACT